MSRREVLINWGRLILLKWRVVHGRALPAIASSLLTVLDRWATQIHEAGR